MCIQYDFEASYQQQCGVLKESWEYHEITTQTTKIGTVYLNDETAQSQTPPAISVETCGRNDALQMNMNIDPPSKIYYDKMQKVHAIRLFSNSGKFAVTSFEPHIHNASTFSTEKSITTIYGDNSFERPTNTSAANGVTFYVN